MKPCLTDSRNDMHIADMISIDRRRVLLLTAALVSTCALGCGEPATTSEGKAAIPSMAAMYGDFLRAHGNKAPQDENQFREFLATKAADLEKAGLSVDAMFVSPRSGGPFVWVYGAKLPSGPMGMSFYGYEKEPVDGKRLAVGARGIREEMDDVQFRKVFPQAG